MDSDNNKNNQIECNIDFENKFSQRKQRKMSVETSSYSSWDSEEEFVLRFSGDEFDESEGEGMQSDVFEGSSSESPLSENEHSLQEQNEISIQRKDNSNCISDDFVLRFSDDELDGSSSEGERMNSDAVEFSTLSKNQLSNLSDRSNSMTSQSSKKQDDKLKMMAVVMLHVDENINLSSNNLESKLEEINQNKSKVQHNISFDFTVHPNGVDSNDLICKLFQAKVVLERCKPSSPSSQVSCRTGQSQKQFKHYTLECSSCKVPPRSCHTNICDNCGSSMIYRCRSCDFITNNFNSAYNHYYRYHQFGPDRLIYCLYCDKEFNCKRRFYCHCQKFHAIEVRNKEKCEKFLQFYTVSKSSNSETYHCYKCNYSSSLRIAIKRHMQTKHKQGLYMMRKTVKSQHHRILRNKEDKSITFAKLSTDFTSYDKEYAKVEDILELRCKNCKKINNPDRVDCNYCSRSSLRYHCHRCIEKFASRFEAIEHAKKHLLKNHVCNCGRNFDRLENLGRHKRYCLGLDMK